VAFNRIKSTWLHEFTHLPASPYYVESSAGSYGPGAAPPLYVPLDDLLCITRQHINADVLRPTSPGCSSVMGWRAWKM